MSLASHWLFFLIVLDNFYILDEESLLHADQTMLWLSYLKKKKHIYCNLSQHPFLLVCSEF